MLQLTAARSRAHAAGAANFALAIDADELDVWRRHLVAEGVDIESEVSWERGRRSMYFRDTDGYSVGLATPGVLRVFKRSSPTSAVVFFGASGFH